MADVFATLNAINVNEHVEKKKSGGTELSYLSWAWAWGEAKKHYPDAYYTIYENADGWCYHTDGKTCWVKTGVTIEGQELIEYLPVMDFRNKSIPLEQVTSFDVNKAIQRSLTKAIARHGLGLYIYAGEDLPEGEREEQAEAKPQRKKSAYQQRMEQNYPADHITEAEAKNLVDELVKNGAKLDYWLKKYKIQAFIELTPEQMIEIYGAIDDYKRNKEQANS